MLQVHRRGSRDKPLGYGGVRDSDTAGGDTWTATNRQCGSSPNKGGRGCNRKTQNVTCWVCAQSLCHVRLLATPWTGDRQAPPSMGFFRREYWSGLPFPSPGDLPDPGMEPESPVSPIWQVVLYPLSHQRSPKALRGTAKTQRGEKDRRWGKQGWKCRSQAMDSQGCEAGSRPAQVLCFG